MFSIETIRDIQQEAASKAAKESQKPLYIDEFDLVLAQRGNFKHLTIPFIGDWLPNGFVRVPLSDTVKGVYPDNTYFVDSSGFGDPSEPALTITQFFKTITPGFYAVVAQGQFQLKVGKFERAGN